MFLDWLLEKFCSFGTLCILATTHAITVHKSIDEEPLLGETHLRCIIPLQLYQKYIQTFIQILILLTYIHLHHFDILTNGPLQCQKRMGWIVPLRLAQITTRKTDLFFPPYSWHSTAPSEIWIAQNRWRRNVIHALSCVEPQIQSSGTLSDLLTVRMSDYFDIILD